MKSFQLTSLVALCLAWQTTFLSSTIGIAFILRLTAITATTLRPRFYTHPATTSFSGLWAALSTAPALGGIRTTLWITLLALLLGDTGCSSSNSTRYTEKKFLHIEYQLDNITFQRMRLDIQPGIPSVVVYSRIQQYPRNRIHE
jgi:hypothetical protein